jgi:hypothetical protein
MHGWRIGGRLLLRAYDKRDSGQGLPSIYMHAALLATTPELVSKIRRRS